MYQGPSVLLLWKNIQKPSLSKSSFAPLSAVNARTSIRMHARPHILTYYREHALQTAYTHLLLRIRSVDCIYSHFIKNRLQPMSWGHCSEVLQQFICLSSIHYREMLTQRAMTHLSGLSAARVLSLRLHSLYAYNKYLLYRLRHMTY